MVERKTPYPRCSMYGLFTYIWVVLGVNVGKYTTHIEHLGMDDLEFPRFAAAGPQCIMACFFGCKCSQLLKRTTTGRTEAQHSIPFDG